MSAPTIRGFRSWPPAMLILVAVLLAGPTQAKIPEPDSIIYGLVTDGVQTVSLKINNEKIDSYQMEANPSAGDNYVLKVPMDALDPRTPGTARPGDLAKIYLDGATNPIRTITIGQKGSVLKLNLIAGEPDNLPDSWEITYFGDLSRDGTGDFDQDGLTDLEEYQKGTNPTKADTDNDTMPDGWEASHCLDPLLNDANQDKDGDGWTNITEYRRKSDPCDANSVPGKSLPWLMLLLGNS